jgi:hypothetical protein
LVITDNVGKKLTMIRNKLNPSFSSHIIFIFISFQTCLERQLSRAKREGRSIKPYKYCKLMKKMEDVFRENKGKTILIGHY